MLESADYSLKSADSNADSPKIGLWVWALRDCEGSRVGTRELGGDVEMLKWMCMEGECVGVFEVSLRLTTF